MAAVALIRVLAATALGVVVAVVGGHVFDELLLELVIGPILVGAATLALIRMRRRWRVLGVAVVGALAVVVTVLVAGGDVGDVVPGLRSGPQRLLSTEWPSPLEPTMIATVALLVTASAAVSTLLAAEPRFRLAPLAPPLVALVAVAALGAPVRPSTPLLIAAAVLAMVTAAIDLRAPAGSVESSEDRRRRLAPDRGVVVTAVVVAAASALVAGSLAWADRADPRDIDEAELSAVLVDPIEATIALRTAEPPIDLLTIDDRSLLSRPAMPGRWRIAAFDRYDGQRWVPDLELRPIGGRLALAEPGPDAIRYEVRFDSDDIDLVPFPGRPIAVDRDVDTDLDRVAVRVVPSPAVGDVILVDAEVAPTLEALDTTPLAERAIDDRAATFTDRAESLAGDGSTPERLARIARTMREQWSLDPQAPGGGQQQALLERFVTDTQRGTREQFVTAFVLLARSLGVDARVAIGFDVPPEERASRFEIRSDHAQVWPEVGLNDGSWVAFDPVPTQEAQDDTEPQPQPDAQSPAAAQPPIAPPADDDAPDDEVVLDEDRTGGGWGTFGRWVVRGAVVGGLALAPILVAVGAILMIKWLRRRRRLRVADPVGRVRGAWANATDVFVDAGVTIAPAWTDDRIADQVAALAPTVHHESQRLAAMSSSVTFGSPSSDDALGLAFDAAATAERIESTISSGFTRRQRIRWRLSLRSLRSGTRSPVVP